MPTPKAPERERSAQQSLKVRGRFLQLIILTPARTARQLLVRAGRDWTTSKCDLGESIVLVLLYPSMRLKISQITTESHHNIGGDMDRARGVGMVSNSLHPDYR